MPMATPEEQSKYQLAWMNKRRQAWLDENGPCAECGSWENLEVDHINPEDKECSPRAIWSRKKEFRDKELAKCQVLCEDCHLEKTKKFLSLLNRGENHRDVKLTEKDVLYIRSSSKRGVDLAAEFNVSKQTISKAKNKHTWKHI